MSNVNDFDWDTGPMEMLEMEYETFLERLFETMIVNDNLDDHEEPLPSVQTASGTEFCGCDVCCTRETFAFLMPRFLKLYEQGYIRKMSSETSTPDN